MHVVLRRALGPAGVPLAFTGGAAAAGILAAHRPAHLAVDFAQPLVVVTGWHDYGAACFALLAATVALASLALVGSLHGAACRPRSFAPVALAAVAAIVAAWAWPFLFSSDVYAYAAYGALALAGADPYRPVAPGLHAPLVDLARWQWGGNVPVCVYGPAFVALAAGVVALGRSPGATFWLLRGLAAAAFVASIAFLDRALARRSARDRATVVTAYGLHPVALWTVAEGHNDALVLAAALAGAALVRSSLRSAALGGALVGAAAALKATAAGLAVGLALIVPAGPSARRTWLGVSLGIALAAAVAVPPLVGALAAEHSGARYAPSASLQGTIGPLATAAVVVAVTGWASAVWRVRRRESMALFTGAAWLAVPNPYPWYALWLLPAALAALDSPGGRALYGVTILGLVRYLPDATGTPASFSSRAVALVAVLPLLAVPLAVRLFSTRPESDAVS